MRFYCCVHGCYTHDDKTYPFPKDPEERKIWEERIGHPLTAKNSQVCWKHFHESCFIDVSYGRKAPKKKLKNGSLPTLCLSGNYDDLNLTNIRYMSRYNTKFGLWKHVKYLGGQSVQCRYCKEVYNYSELRSKFRRHLQTEHQDDVEISTQDYCKDDGIIDVNSPPERDPLEIRNTDGIGEKYEVIEYMEDHNYSGDLLSEFGDYVTKELQAMAFLDDQYMLMRKIKSLINETKMEIKNRISDVEVSKAALSEPNVAQVLDPAATVTEPGVFVEHNYWKHNEDKSEFPTLSDLASPKLETASTTKLIPSKAKISTINTKPAKSKSFKVIKTKSKTTNKATVPELATKISKIIDNTSLATKKIININRAVMNDEVPNKFLRTFET